MREIFFGTQTAKYVKETVFEQTLDWIVMYRIHRKNQQLLVTSEFLAALLVPIF